ncbi:MAG: hypothetical protein V4675_22755 [Verrucomicrobiota bacterium]
MRRYMRASAIAGPVIFFAAFLLMAGGYNMLGMVFCFASMIGFLAFPYYLPDSVAHRPQISDTDKGVLGSVGRAAKTAILLWVILQPEFGNFLVRVMEGGALWDWRLMVPGAVLTVYSMIRGWSQVSGISDQAIYAYFSPSDSSRPSASTPG